MKNSKAMIVTILLMALIAVIHAGLYALYLPGFQVMTGIMALYGFIHGAKDFRGWITKDANVVREATATQPEMPGELTVISRNMKRPPQKKKEAYDWQLFAPELNPKPEPELSVVETEKEPETAEG